MNTKLNNIFKGDKVIWMVFLFLCIISVVEVFSASSGLTYKSGNFVSPIMKHAGTLLVGAVIAVVVMNVPCKYFKLVTPLLLIISYLTLIWVLVAGESINGANRVIAVGGQTFQPSEIAKGTVILAQAQIMSAMQYENGADKHAFRYILYIAVPIAILIGLENLSTAALLMFVVFLMMIVGRIPARQILMLAGTVLLMGVLAFSAVMLIGDDSKAEKEEKNLAMTETAETPKKRTGIEKLFHRADTWKGRIHKFTRSSEIAPEDYDLDKDAQVAHANIAIVSSNIIGRGPGNSTERDFLAQAYSDFIFAIIIEELGLAGAAFVVFLYVVLLFRAAIISNRCENNFPAFLAMGFALLLVTQAMFNMMVAVGLAPVTGQPLPLISKGGTSTMLNCAYIGAILSVSLSAKKKKTVKKLAVVE